MQQEYNMIRGLAVDDEPLALRQLTNFIQRIPYLKLAASCSSALNAREVLLKEPIDAVFCDINMPDLNGMDFIKSLNDPPLVVFTTAYSEYALEGFKVDAVDYLLKPFGLDEFRRAAEKLQKRIGLSADVLPAPVPAIADTAREAPAGKIEAQTDSIFVKVENRMVKITLSDIYYIEGMSEYLKIHLKGNDEQGQPRKPVIVLYSLKRMEERLPDIFMRIHRSFIINLRYVREVTKTRVDMGNSILLPIGELYRENLNNYLLRNYIGK